MGKYLRNEPARGWSYSKIAVATLWLAAFLVLGATIFTQAACAFYVQFDTSQYPNDAWLQIQDPNFASSTANFQGSYTDVITGNSTTIDFSTNPPYSGPNVLMSVPVKIARLQSGKLTITYSNGAVLFIFYDDPSANSRTAAPSQMVSTQRFQAFELTMTGHNGDSGDLTAINWFTAPMSLNSYASDPTQSPPPSPLQTVGYGNTTAAQVASHMAAITQGNPQAVLSANGYVVRYLGPSNYNGNPNPWPSFIPYTQSINTAGQSTSIQTANAFHFSGEPLPNYFFGCTMTATAGSNGSVTASGDITVTWTGTIKPGNPTPPLNDPDQYHTAPWYGWPNATIVFSAAEGTNPPAPADFNNAIYGQAANNNSITFPGTAWNQFQAFTQSTLQFPGQPHDPASNPSLYDLTAYNTTLNKFVGEVTTGLLGGYFNSTYIPAGYTTMIKDMPSSQWWNLNPIVGFSEIQSNNAYYNQYAGVIFATSGNTVYGVPFTDRFGTGPVVDSVSHNNHSVLCWVLGIEPPLTNGVLADFTANPTSGPAPLAVQFTDSSTASAPSTITNWSWDFGDGSSSTAQSPSHTYNNAGTYMTTLTVTGSQGGSSSKSHVVVVGNSSAPVANFTANPTSGLAPLAVQFTDTSTGSVTSWAWTFGDGGSSAAQNPSHTYNNPGTYTVTLTVTGPGGSDSKIGTIKATTTAPVANFTANPTSGPAPLAVQFTDTSTGSINTRSWDFGDGSGGSTAQNPSHTYTNPGTYTVTLTVTGPGGSNSKPGTITVTTPNPAISLSTTSLAPSCYLGQNAQSQSFLVSNSGGGTLNYTITKTQPWLTVSPTGGSSTGAANSHQVTYSTAKLKVGTYHDTITVSGAGASNTPQTIQVTLTVAKKPAPPVANFTASPTSGTAPLTVQFTDHSTGIINTWSWSFGDGSSSTSQNPSHTYTGQHHLYYSATLTVTGPGGSRRKQVAIKVR